MNKFILIIVFLGLIISCKKRQPEPLVMPGDSTSSGTRIQKLIIESGTPNTSSVTYIPNYNASGQISSITIIDSTNEGIAENTTTLLYTNGYLTQRLRGNIKEVFTYNSSNRILNYELDSGSASESEYAVLNVYSFTYNGSGQMISVSNSRDVNTGDSLIITNSSSNIRNAKGTAPDTANCSNYYDFIINPDSTFIYIYEQLCVTGQVSGKYSQLKNTIPSVLWDEITQKPNGLRFTTGYLDLIFKDMEPNYFIVESTGYTYQYITDSYGRLEKIIENNSSGINSRTFTFYY